MKAGWGASLLRRLNLVCCVVTGLGLVIALERAGENPKVSQFDDGGRGAALLVILGLLAVYFTANLVIRPFGTSVVRYWISSVAFSLCCVIGMSGIWLIVHNSHYRERILGEKMETAAAVDWYLAHNMPPGPQPRRVPTGVYIESMEFDTGNNVLITGYIWQRVAKDLPASAIGVALPETHGTSNLTEAYRRDLGSETLIGWYLNARFRLQFDYAQYPIDRQDISLRMWSSDFARGVMLVPDLQSYPPWQAHGVFGLDKRFARAGWNPHYSVFTYVRIDYDSSFGDGAYKKTKPYPELYFHVGFDRSFRGPLTETVLPLAFVAILVFAAMFITTTDSERRLVVGWSTLTTITFAMSALLVVALRHNAILTSTETPKLVYLESFPFVMYFMIMATAVNSILFATTQYRFLHWRENLLPALLFWPVLTGALLLLTLVAFWRPPIGSVS
ncbi:hypothetical protein [Longispora albida]|uniref:hypothetical protein n=1 Tax=Longispora albida TaxID=203523 RepID=UPI0003785630|nr:hypothetical protein [Longispora albida]